MALFGLVLVSHSLVLVAALLFLAASKNKFSKIIRKFLFQEKQISRRFQESHRFWFWQ